MSILHIAEALRRLPAGSVFPSEESTKLFSSLERLIGPKSARALMDVAGPIGVSRMQAPEIAITCAVPLSVAERVVAARDLGEALDDVTAPKVTGSGSILGLLPLGFRNLETEVLLGFVLSGQMTVKAVVVFAKGGDVGCSVSARDIFVPLVRLAAVAVVLVHNHPGGDPTPSAEDVRFTNAVAHASTILGIELIDHLVVATGGTVSFRDVGLMPTDAELAS